MLELNATQKTILALLRHALGKNYEPIPDGVDWKAVISEAYQQAVPCLVCESMSELGPDEEMKGLAEKQIIQMFGVNAKAAYAAQQTDELMRKNGYKYAILKGCAAASWYPKPECRMLGDVDFLIDSAQQRNVEAALEAAEYKRWDTKEHVCHVVFRKPGQNLEMHFEIAGIPHGVQGERVRAYMKDALNEIDEASVLQAHVCVPKPKYHGLVLLLHMQHHMLGEGLGLRHLMDFGVFIDRTEKDEFWNTDLIPVLKEIGLFKYAKVMAKTSSMYFGTACPEWASDAEEDLCDAVMNDILAGGNFGRKNADRARAGMMISEHGKEGTKHGKIYNLYHTLHESTPNYHPEIRNHKVLWFFADCGRALKYLGYMMIGKRSSLAKMSNYSDERRSVYNRLNVFETNNQ